MKRSPIEGREVEFRQMIRDGLLNQEIAKHFGCSNDHVRIVANRLGIKTKRQVSVHKNRPTYAGKLWENNTEFLRLARKGKNAYQLADYFNISSTAIYKHARENGIKLASTGGTTNPSSVPAEPPPQSLITVSWKNTIPENLPTFMTAKTDIDPVFYNL